MTWTYYVDPDLRIVFILKLN